MICARCLHRLTFSLRPLPPVRPLYTTTRHLAPASISPNHSTQTSPRGAPSGTHEGPPAATSKSAAQPFSTPFTPHVPPLPASASETPAAPKSSVKAGTVLRGLGYVKAKEGPVAKEDSEYPAWLWGLLVEAEKKAEGKDGKEGEGDLYSKSKKQRRIASKRAAASALLASSSPHTHRKIPLEHQSIDLPAGDGSMAGAIAAAAAREELRGAMRNGRRKGIKEANFLKGMK
ncbi:hypothetical protein MMC08_005353 [Hypocenomyce scalaris]|nr:hypothetical protein [Hypocenomyce scalaris]